MTTRPITWLASYPKSGNTWVRMFLDCYISGRPVDINDVDNRTCRGDLDLLTYQAASVLPLPGIDREHHALLRGAALLNSIAGREHSILKTHFENNAAWIPPQLTRGAVYLVRDPRDVACSWASHCDISIDEAIDHLTTRMCYLQDSGLAFHAGTWASNVESWCEWPTVRYEDMRRLPQSSFATIVEACGLEYDEDRFYFALRESRFANLQRQEQANGFIEKRGGDAFFRQGKVGAWREVLTPEQVERIEAECGEVMQKCGYELSTVGAGHA